MSPHVLHIPSTVRTPSSTVSIIMWWKPVTMHEWASGAGRCRAVPLLLTGASDCLAEYHRGAELAIPDTSSSCIVVRGTPLKASTARDRSGNNTERRRVRVVGERPRVVAYDDGRVVG